MSTQAQLVLQYPDWQSGKIRLLASTSDRRALAFFKGIVMQEAQLRLLACDDPILRIEYEDEMKKLERLLGALIPDSTGDSDV